MERLCTTGVYSIEGGYNAAQLWQVMCRIHIVDTLRLKQQESCSKNDYIQHDMIWSENDMWNDIIWYYDTTWYDNGYTYLIYKHLTIYIILYIYINSNFRETTTRFFRPWRSILALTEQQRHQRHGAGDLPPDVVTQTTRLSACHRGIGGFMVGLGLG